MKRFLLIMLVLLSTAVFAKAKRLSAEFYCAVTGMECCDSIKTRIEQAKGVKEVDCYPVQQKVIVSYDATKTDIPTLLMVFESMGKKANLVYTKEVRSTTRTDTKNGETTNSVDAETGASQLY